MSIFSLSGIQSNEGSIFHLATGCHGAVKETWAPVEGFPDYAVSNYGEVMNARLGHILHPRMNSYGHFRVTLRADGRSVDFYVHRLVAATFAGGFTPHCHVYPVDGDWGNAEITNLRIKGRGLGTYKKNQPEVRRRVVRIVETGETFNTVVACADHIGADPSTVYKVLKGHRESHKGYSFEYAEE